MYVRHGLALIGGVLLPLSLAPFHQPLLAFLSAAFLLLAWNDCPPKMAAIRGFLFGIGAFTTGVHWVYIAIHRYGNAPLFFAVLLTALFILVLSIYPMVQGYFLNRFFSKPSALKFLVFFPLSWVIFDLLRSWVFTGFPWLYLGYSQMDTILKFLSPYGTVYLLTFITAFIGATLISPLFLKRWQWISAFVMSCMIFLTAYYLSYENWNSHTKTPIKVSIIQGNIPQEDKWDSELILQTTQKYRQLTDTLWNSDLIIWPEAAIPVFQTNAEEYIQEIDQTAKEKNTNVIFGIPIAEDGIYYNALMLVGESKGTYKKRHLVPFGEYTPFEPLSTWVMDKLTIPMSNFKPGPKHQKLLDVDGVKIAAFICYEIIYPFLVRNSLPEANLLLVLSDDSWFGESIAKYQHLQMAQMRAIENNRFVIFSTNTGVTAIINPKGEIQQKLPEDQVGVLTGTVYGISK